MAEEAFGKYRILEKIGEGGMGTVHKAYDPNLQRNVVLKFLASGLITNEEAIERFKQEPIAASALNHPGICTIHEIDEIDGRLYIAMAYYDGEVLSDKLERGKPELAFDTIRGYTIQAAKALAAAHGAGIIHRDIKPANIMVTVDDRVVLLDFGVAKDLRGSSAVTKPNTVVGTLHYTAPELLEGRPLDERVDVWALGAVLYEMLTRQRPFQGEYESAILYEILNEEPQPIAELRPDAPEDLIAVATRALSKDAGQRYSSMNEMIAALEGGDVPASAAKTTVSRVTATSESKSLDPNVGRKYCHVLFIDIVKFSTRTLDEKEDLVSKLRDAVNQSPDYDAEKHRGKVIGKDTGDGMLLAFLDAPLAPIRCAVSVTQALSNDPRMTLRMGVHGGLATVRENIQGQSDVTGGAVDHAQRIMDCGDTGHIMLSQVAANDARQTEDFRPHLHDLGEFRAKHGETLQAVSLHSAGFGNAACPGNLVRRGSLRAGIALGCLAPLVAALPFLKMDAAARLGLEGLPRELLVGAGIVLAALAVVVVVSAYRQFERFKREFRIAPRYLLTACVPLVLSALLTVGLVDRCKFDPSGSTCVVVPDLKLTYWVEVFLLGGTLVDPPRVWDQTKQSLMFPNESAISLYARAEHDGRLYLINEAAKAREGLPDYALLFPSGDEASAVAAGTEQRIADLEFVVQTGTEKVFLVWSAERIPELERLTSSASGRVEDPQEIAAIQTFIGGEGSGAPEIVASEGQVTISDKAKYLIYRLDFSTL